MKKGVGVIRTDEKRQLATELLLQPFAFSASYLQIIVLILRRCLPICVIRIMHHDWRRRKEIIIEVHCVYEKSIRIVVGHFRHNSI